MNDEFVMSEEIEALAATLNDALENFYEPFDWHEATRISARILAAGYAKPRQINNYSELAALPYGSAVLTSDISDTVVLRSDRDDFMNQSGYTIPARTLWDYGSKPLTVLWEPLP